MTRIWTGDNVIRGLRLFSAESLYWSYESYFDLRFVLTLTYNYMRSEGITVHTEYAQQFFNLKNPSTLQDQLFHIATLQGGSPKTEEIWWPISGLLIKPLYLLTHPPPSPPSTHKIMSIGLCAVL
jgi:hypothetical protein